MTFSTLVTPTRESEMWRVGTWFWTSSSEMAMRLRLRNSAPLGARSSPREHFRHAGFRATSHERVGGGALEGPQDFHGRIGSLGTKTDVLLTEEVSIDGDRGAPSTHRGGPGEGLPHVRADLLGAGGDGDHQGAGGGAARATWRTRASRSSATTASSRSPRAGASSGRPTRTRRASPRSTSRSSRAWTRCGCTCARSGACSCSPRSARSRSPSGSSAVTSRPSRRWWRRTCASSSPSPRATWAAGSRSWT